MNVFILFVVCIRRGREEAGSVRGWAGGRWVMCKSARERFLCVVRKMDEVVTDDTKSTRFYFVLLGWTDLLHRFKEYKTSF